MLSHFDTIPERDRQTDRQTELCQARDKIQMILQCAMWLEFLVILLMHCLEILTVIHWVNHAI